jgi:hypothetical protein
VTDEEVERFARILCTADGFDPNVTVSAFGELPRGPKGRHVVFPDSLQPAWVLYQSQAMSVITALKGDN